MLKVVKVVWLLLCIALAVWRVVGIGDAELVATYLLGLLTMPIGLVVYVLGSLGLQEVSGAGTDFNHSVTIVIYNLAILAGYIQWFVLLPMVLQKIRSKKRPTI